MADRQVPTKSHTGIWVDTQTGQVVTEEPEQGKQLVPPGGEVDQRVRDDVEAARLVSGQTDDPFAEKDDTVDEQAEPVEQADDKPRRARSVQKATDADKAEKATE